MDTTPATTRGTNWKAAALTGVVLAGVVMVILPNFSYSGRGSRVQRTLLRLKELRWTIEEYNREHEAYPDRLALLIPDYIAPDGPLKDAWRRDFVYTPAASAGHPFALSSNGPDGLPGTKDDLDAWTMN